MASRRGAEPDVRVNVAVMPRWAGPSSFLDDDEVDAPRFRRRTAVEAGGHFSAAWQRGWSPAVLRPRVRYAGSAGRYAVWVCGYEPVMGWVWKVLWWAAKGVLMWFVCLLLWHYLDERSWAEAQVAAWFAVAVFSGVYPLLDLWRSRRGADREPS
ncbi:hypothetical protein ACFYYH_34245 [Streptomyces sp. NPDC002018]|uniref:hypothetical protein n=1 Tax=Streptomyces sp. NPDC002018 TaxID=3364629 RepID=UPI003692FE9C